MTSAIPMSMTNLMTGEQAGSFVDQLFHLWMLPAQIGLRFMEGGIATFAAMTSAMPAAKTVAAQGGETARPIRDAAEEQLALVDEGGETLPTPAALVA